MRILASVVAVSAVLAVVAAGCGSETSPEEKWADSVCTDIGDWKDQVQQATDDITAELQAPEAGTLAAIDADVQTAVNATSQLADNLKALGAPDTESGTQAKQQVDALATELEGTVNEAKQTIDSLPTNADPTEIAKQLAPLAPSLQSLATKTSSTLAAVQEESDELKEGFDNADSCEQFR